MPCDTFVISLPVGDSFRTIFAKNSDRPGDEIQEVVAVKGQKNSKENILKVSIDVFVQFTYFCAL